LAYNPPGHVNL